MSLSCEFEIAGCICTFVFLNELFSLPCSAFLMWCIYETEICSDDTKFFNLLPHPSEAALDGVLRPMITTILSLLLVIPRLPVSFGTLLKERAEYGSGVSVL